MSGKRREPVPMPPSGQYLGREARAVPRGRAGLVLLAAAGLVLLGGCGDASVLAPAGPVGSANRTILLNSLAIMLAIVIPTIIATIGFAWWFRAGNDKAEYRPDFVYSGRVEMIVWSIPILVILFLSGVIWVGSHQLDPRKPLASNVPPLEVEVVALDWKWLFIYPNQGVASVNQLMIPAGVPVHFRLTSASVMNAFFVPRLGSMIYAMNGMRTELNLQADKPGTYYGQSAHFSGDGFPDMNFQAYAVPAAQFNAWVAGTRGRGPALDARGYTLLAQQSQGVKPYNYGAVAPGLFDAIVSQKLKPGPGPSTGRDNKPQISPGTVENAR
jgi:cytochrome o ubiquinol oxidase subunit II